MDDYKGNALDWQAEPLSVPVRGCPSCPNALFVGSQPPSPHDGSNDPATGSLLSCQSSRLRLRSHRRDVAEHCLLQL